MSAGNDQRRHPAVRAVLFDFAGVLTQPISEAFGVGAARAGVDEGLLRSVLSMLDIGPEEALVLDDSLPNVTAARDLGMRAIHVADHAAAIAEARRWCP